MKRILFTHFNHQEYLSYKSALNEISSGLAVSHLESSDKLFNLLRFFTPDLLFIDLSQRKNDAINCLQRLRSEQKFSSLKIIIHSTSFNFDHLNGFHSSKNNFYLTKPFSENDLRRTVEEALTMDSNPETFASSEAYAIN